MAEEPNQELSMDDILSSIRSILMEDNAAQQADAQPTPPQEDEKQVAEPVVAQAEPEDDASLLSALPNVDNLPELDKISDANETPISVDDLPGMNDSDEVEELSAEDEVFNLSPSMIIDDPQDKITLENPADSSEPEISEDDILNLSNLASLVQDEPQPQAPAAPKNVPDLHAPLAADVLSGVEEDEATDTPFSLDDELDTGEEIHLDDLPSADFGTPSQPEPEEKAAVPEFTIADKETLDSELAAEEEKKKEDIKAALPPLDFDLPKVDVDADPIFEPESQTVTDIDANMLKESISGNMEGDAPQVMETEPQPEPEPEPQPESQAIDDALLQDILGTNSEEHTKQENMQTEESSANEVAEPLSDAQEVYTQNSYPEENIAPLADEGAEPQAWSDVSQQTKTNEEPQDAADVSANIINNFAKLFAEKKAAQTETMTEPEPEVMTPSVEPVKNSSQSIAELVREAVVKQVTQQMDVNFETYAKEAVAAQTQAWLDANLPAIVEAVVAKEIERVMAKVGS